MSSRAGYWPDGTSRLPLIAHAVSANRSSSVSSAMVPAALGGRLLRQDWQDEWQALLRSRDEALARSRGFQEEITAFFRRRQPPPMQLMRTADVAEGELNAVKARLRDFLRHLGHAGT